MSIKMTTEERRRRRFSESFRKEQVELMESGAVTVQEVSRLYQVKADNVRRWLKKYGQQDLPGPIIISSRKDYDRLSELEKENTSLKAFIGEQQIELVYLKQLLCLAKEKLGPDFEKKC